MSEITLAAALKQINRLKGQIAEQTKRANGSVVWVEGKPPAFEFAEAVRRRGDLVEALRKLQVAVAATNATTLIPGEGTAFSAIRRLEELKGEIAFYQALNVRTQAREVETSEVVEYDYASSKNVRTKTEIVYLVALTEVDRAACIERLQDEFFNLNAKLDALNARTHIQV